MIVAEFTNETNDLTTENLYQWDSYQTLRISGIDFGSVTPKVHFANKKSTEALVVEGNLERAYLYVSIPNSLLTQKYDIVAYVYTNTGLTSKTIKSITIPVIPRLKPSEYYQPTDEDIAQIEAIELEAKAIIDGLIASQYDETKTYKRPNIVYYNRDAYMCKSNTEITGILPTDTENWQLIFTSDSIVSIHYNPNIDKVEVITTGGNYTLDYPTVTGDTVEAPALELTEYQVNTLKKVPNMATWEGVQRLVNEHVNADSSGNFYVSKYGLYAVTLSYKNANTTNFNSYTVTRLIHYNSVYGIPEGKVNYYEEDIEIWPSKQIVCINSDYEIKSVILLVNIG